MKKTVTLSIDAMGGDFGAQVVLAGLQEALIRKPHLKFLICGDETVIKQELSKFPSVEKVSTLQHAEVAIAMDEKPSQALRKGRGKSSLWGMLEAVKTGQVQAAVSAGNTGALMAMSKFCLKTLPDIERPAIAALWPTLTGECVVLDVGATVGADSELLVDFAIMGAAMSTAIFHKKKPKVALLNVGVEEVKGLDQIKSAGKFLKEGQFETLDYFGFVEGDDIGKGIADVIVTEGFSGNIALKTAEGTARQIGAYLKSAMSRTLMAKIGYLFAKNAFDALKEKMDPRKVNGGVFLGLNGLVIKSHGGTDALGFASAVELAANMVENNLQEKIASGLSHARSHMMGLESQA